MDNLFWFMGILAVLWIVWFATGGPDAGRADKPFLRPPAPVDSGATYGPTDLVPTGGIIQKRKTEQEKPQDDPNTPADKRKEQISIFGGKVSFTFQGKSGARTTDPSKEYIEVIASKNNKNPINITGWTVKSAVTGKSIAIQKGAYLPYSGRVNTEAPIFLQPNEKAIIGTGYSPIGVSFRLNTCTGYFEQFQNFTPRLPSWCPYPKNEDIPAGVTDACLDFIDRLPRCKVYIKPLPLELSGDPVCQEYIGASVTYNSCVDTHKNEKNFYKKEWRVYLSRGQELWKERRETILLLDNTGKLVDSVSY